MIDYDARSRKFNLYCIETPEHVFFEFKETAFMRNKKWNDIVEHNSTPNIIDYLNQVDSKSKLMYTLNCFNIEYIKEWEDLYIHVIVYISDIYLNHIKPL